MRCCAYVNDPAAGRRKLTEDELSESYANVVLTFNPTYTFRREKRGGGSGILKTALGYNNGLGANILFGTAGSVLLLAGILFFQSFFDKIHSGSEPNGAYAEMIIFPVCIISAAVLWLLRSSVGCRFRSKFILRSAKEFTEKLLRLPAGFYEQRYTGESVNRMKKNHAVIHFITDELTTKISDFLTVLLSAAIMLRFSPLLTLISAGFIAAQEAISFLTAGYLRKNTAAKICAYESILAGKLYTGISEMETLKAAGAEYLYLRSLVNNQKKLSKQRKKIAAAGRSLSLCRTGIFLISLSVLTAVCVSMLNSHIENHCCFAAAYHISSIGQVPFGNDRENQNDAIQRGRREGRAGFSERQNI